MLIARACSLRGLSLSGLLLLCALVLGCQPLVRGDRSANPLLGEWEVARTDDGPQGKPPWRAFIFAFQPDSASVFGEGSTKPATYTLEGDALSLRLSGYRPERFTVLHREGGFDLRHEPSGTVFHLVSRQRFDGVGFFAPLLFGLCGLAILCWVGGDWRVFVNSGAWPEVTAQVISTGVEKNVSSGGKRSSSGSHLAKVKFRYPVGERWLEGTNDAGYNRWVAYGKEQAQAQVERWRSEGLTVRYDPLAPEQVFLGRRQFPFLTTCAATVMGTFLAVGLAAAGGDAVGWAGYEVLKLGTVDWTVFAVFGALPLYLLGARLRAWIAGPSARPAG